MEDLRITGYNALLTPAFLQEEFPAVSFFKKNTFLTRVFNLFFLTV